MQTGTNPPNPDKPKDASFEVDDGVAWLEVDVDVDVDDNESIGVIAEGLVDKPVVVWPEFEDGLLVDDIEVALLGVVALGVVTAEVLAGALVHFVPNGSLIVTVINLVLAGCACGVCKALGHFSAPALAYCVQPGKMDVLSTQSKVSHAPEVDWKYAEPQIDCWSHLATQAS